MTKDTLVLNLFAGPGTGKSTMAAHVFALLKWQGVNCELAPEYAKDKTWEKSLGVLAHQQYVFGKQWFRIARLEGQVDVVVSDSPLLHSLVYGAGHNSPEFTAYVLSEHERRWNYNVFLERVKPYNPSGRNQDEDEAKVLDRRIRDTLDLVGVDYDTYDGTASNAERIANKVIRLLAQGRVTQTPLF